MAKKIEKKNEETKVINNVAITFDGKVSLINYSSEKLFDGTIAINREIPNGKVITDYIHCKWFNPTIELEKDDTVVVSATFGTDSYEDKKGKKHYNTFINIVECEVV